MNTLTARSILTQARRLIEKEENWCKGQMDDGKGRYCAEGARAQAMRRLFGNGVDWHSRAIQMSADLLYSAIPDPECGCITTYNDHEATTHADVLAWFDSAIKMAQEKA